MSVSPAQWKQIYRRFNPRQRIEANEGDLFVTRPHDAAEKIARRIEHDLEPQAATVLCGSFGSGKSSELLHLGAQLWEQRAVVGVDIFQSAAQINQISAAEVLFLIGAATVQSASEHWGVTVDSALLERLERSFLGLLRETVSRASVGEIIKGVALFTASLAAPAPALAVATGAAAGAAQAASGALGLRPRAVLGGLTRPSRDGEADLDGLVDAVNGILATLAEVRPPVVLVDGLDKVSELPSIRALFSSSRALARLAFPVVYAAPITLMLTPEGQAAEAVFKRERLTNVIVHRPALERLADHLSDEEIAAGRAALVEVVSRRLQREGLSVDDAFEVGALDRLIDASGGLMRELIQLVNRAAERALYNKVGCIGQGEAESAVAEVRKEYAFALNTERVNELVHVRKRGEPTGANAVAAELLLGGFVLPYANGDVWYEPHPILRGLRLGL